MADLAPLRFQPHMRFVARLSRTPFIFEKGSRRVRFAGDLLKSLHPRLSLFW